MERLSKKFEIKNKLRKELGASLVEYGLIVALVAAIAIPSVLRVGENVNLKLGDGDLMSALGAGEIEP